jgi:hypothetical protein
MTSISVSPSCRLCRRRKRQTRSRPRLLSRPSQPARRSTMRSSARRRRGRSAPSTRSRARSMRARSGRRSMTHGCRAKRCSTGSRKTTQRHLRAAPRPCRLTASRRRRDALQPLSARHRRRLRQREHLGPVARLDRKHLGELYRALRRRQRRRAAIAWRRLLRQQSLRSRSRGVVPRLLPKRGIGLRRRHGRSLRRGRLADRGRRAFGLGRVGRAVRRPRRGRSPRRELHRDARTGLARRRLGERGLRDLDARAAQRSDDVRDLADDAERHDRLAACLRRADAERDDGVRQRSLDSVLDRRTADRARRARPRTRRRPPPDLEHQRGVYYSGLLSSSASDNAIKAKLEATF